MKPRNVPFWWVIKGGSGYLDSALGWLPRQSLGERFTTRHDAKKRLARLMSNPNTCRESMAPAVVLVHAKPRGPKVPAWVKPVVFHYRNVQVFRESEGMWTQYVFHVSGCLTMNLSEGVIHTEGLALRRSKVAASVDVWAEAAQRAAKLLREQKAKK